MGKVEYEVGAALRNPCAHPSIFADAEVIARRIGCFTRTLDLDGDRVLGWTYVQAVLAAIWAVEDGEAAPVIEGWIAFAQVVRPMVKAHQLVSKRVHRKKSGASKESS